MNDMLDQDPTERGVPPLALWLGWGGVVPFAAAALELWLMPAAWYPFLESALLAYSAVILAFLGAVHWGLAMRSHADIVNLQLGLSVLPALVAWVLLLLPAFLALPCFIVCFSLTLLADSLAVRGGLAPPWFKVLRTPLTVAGVLCLAVAYAQLLLR